MKYLVAIAALSFAAPAFAQGEAAKPAEAAKPEAKPAAKEGAKKEAPKKEAKKAPAKKAREFSGTLVDAKCWSMDHKNVGDKHGDMEGCGKACLSSGLPAGLLVGHRLYVLAADPKALADHVGQKAKVEGEAKGEILIPSSTIKVTGADGKEIEIGSGGHAE